MALLCEQPRAGARRPGRPRLIVGEPESHANHCATVAVYAVLLSLSYGADPAQPYSAVSHTTFTTRVGPTPATPRMPCWACGSTESRSGYGRAPSGSCPPSSEEPSKTRWIWCSALARRKPRRFRPPTCSTGCSREALREICAFTLDQALADMDLIHPGPVQRFHLALLGQRGGRRAPKSLTPSAPGGHQSGGDTDLRSVSRRVDH